MMATEAVFAVVAASPRGEKIARGYSTRPDDAKYFAYFAWAPGRNLLNQSKIRAPAERPLRNMHRNHLSL